MKRFLATVIACAAICAVWAQSRTVRGTVTDAADGSPVVGVAVTVENGTAAAVTGLEGDYTIKASQGQTLVFSFPGHDHPVAQGRRGRRDRREDGCRQQGARRGDRRGLRNDQEGDVHRLGRDRHGREAQKTVP